MVDFQYLSDDAVSNLAQSYVLKKHRIPKSKNECSLIQFMLWSQYQKVKNWHTSNVMRKFYHEIEAFPTQTFGKETNTENSTSRLVSFVLEHIFNDAFDRWKKSDPDFTEANDKDIDVHEYYDGPKVSEDYFDAKPQRPTRAAKRKANAKKQQPKKRASSNTKDDRDKKRLCMADNVEEAEAYVIPKKTKNPNVSDKPDKNARPDSMDKPKKKPNVDKDKKPSTKTKGAKSDVSENKSKGAKSDGTENNSKGAKSDVIENKGKKKSTKKVKLIKNLKTPSDLHSPYFQNKTSKGVVNASFSPYVTFLPDTEKDSSEELKERFKKAIIAPELGCVFVDYVGDIHLLTTDHLVKQHSREYLDGIGKESRKKHCDNEHPLSKEIHRPWSPHQQVCCLSRTFSHTSLGMLQEGIFSSFCPNRSS
jgi:hypothetical protein